MSEYQSSRDWGQSQVNPTPDYRTAPTSAAGATKPDELTSSPEPAPALRAAWVDEAMRLADGYVVQASGDTATARHQYSAAREALLAHLSRASGLLPVAREGLSDEQIIEHGRYWSNRRFAEGASRFLIDFARAIEAEHGIAPASGDAPGEAK